MDAGLNETWLIVEVNHQPLAFNCAAAKELVILPPVTEVPYAPPYVRGVIDLRGRVVPVVDLRHRLGLATAQQEADALCTLIRERAQDHKNWLNSLLASVMEQREITCTTDPHACAFGKWYDHYRSDNLLVAQFLKKFDEPHKRLHALAAEVKTLIASGCREDALALVESARGTVLGRMLELFAEFETLVRTGRREIAVVLECGGSTFAVCVDGVESVERLSMEQTHELGALGLHVPDGICLAAVKRSKGERPVLTLAAERIMKKTALQAKPANEEPWQPAKAA